MTIEERLTALETELGRANRRARWLAFALVLAVGAAAFCAGPQAAKKIRAGSFALVDNNNHDRAVLEMVDGMPQLALNDYQGTTRIHLGIKSAGPGLALFDKQGRQRAVIAVSEDGSLVAITGEQENSRAVLAVGNREGPSAHLRDSEGQYVWTAP